jgi:hypothetical protein
MRMCRPWARGMVLTEWRCRRGRRCLGGEVVRLGGGRMRCAANFSEPILAPRYGRAAAEANFCARGDISKREQRLLFQSNLEPPLDASCSCGVSGSSTRQHEQ